MSKCINNSNKNNSNIQPLHNNAQQSTTTTKQQQKSTDFTTDKRGQAVQQNNQSERGRESKAVKGIVTKSPLTITPPYCHRTAVLPLHCCVASALSCCLCTVVLPPHRRVAAASSCCRCIACTRRQKEVETTK
jgi:hypothetical protein